MQVLTLKPRFRWGMSVLVAMCMLLTGSVQAVQWQNEQPIWEYEDDSPEIPIDVRLKLFNLKKAYDRAGDYHNDHFVEEYTRREYPNTAFAWRWESFQARWIAFNDYLQRYSRSILVNAAYVTAGRTTVDFDHAQLAGTTRMVLEALVEKARLLTFYLEDDTVRTRWEIFVDRLETLEEVIKELD